jgi:glycosyltransferase involved in cell wall biosynthesis
VLPRISIVTPSYNQAPFLERTIRSVLDQRYENLEYIVVDGGSTDGSLDIIRRYSSRLAHWVSEPDRGQADAINKGLRRATGDWLAWQNSDDVYFPGVFASLARAAIAHPSTRLIIGDMVTMDDDDRRIHEHYFVRPTYGSLRAEGMLVVNQAAFWHREVHERIGYISESYSCVFDYDWFLRVTEKFPAWHVPEIWGGLRMHDASKTAHLHAKFCAEFADIQSHRSFAAWKIPIYQFRRALLTLLDGRYRYVAAGVADRVRSAITGRPRKIRAGPFDGQT